MLSQPHLTSSPLFSQIFTLILQEGLKISYYLANFLKFLPEERKRERKKERERKKKKERKKGESDALRVKVLPAGASAG